MSRCIIIMVCLISLMGCEFVHDQRRVYVRDRGQDYLDSDLIPSLEVPSHLSQYHTDVFPLPDYVPNSEGLDDISLTPPGFGQSL